MSIPPYVLEESNLSRAWVKVIFKLLNPGVTEISPLVVTIDLPQGKAIEIPEVKALIDDRLGKFGIPLCDTTANTIFPHTLWTPEKDRQELYQRYLQILPKLKKYPCNRYGLYFERLIAHSGAGGGKENQLEHILRTWDGGNHRRSALQADVFDVALDHTHQRQRGFPCLQNVTFAPGPEGLTVCGFYAIQNIFDRAYGNYLGLYRLGKFMSQEMGIPLCRLRCTTNFAVLGKPKKGDLSELKKELLGLIKQSEPISGDGSGSLRLEHEGFTLLDDRVEELMNDRSFDDGLLEKEEYAKTR